MQSGEAPPGKKGRRKSGAKLLSASDGTSKLSGAEKERLKRYVRGDANVSKGVKKQRLRRGIKRDEAKIGAAARRAAQAELLLPTQAGFIETETDMEMTARLSQRQVAHRPHTWRTATPCTFPPVGC